MHRKTNTTNMVETKRRKIEPPPSTKSISAANKDAAASSVNTFSAAQVIQNILHPGQAKNFAVAQAQQDGCKANFKVSDSPFGNFLVPAIPTRAELGD